MRAGATLIFVGQESSEGELNRLLSIAKSLGIELSVHFAGVTSEAADWLRLSDVFLSLSEYEGMPLSPIEAYGSGLPLILSSIPGHAIFSEDALLIHNPLEEQDVARFEDLLLQSTAESLKQRSRFFSDRLTWRENYGVDKMVKKYFEIYREICS